MLADANEFQISFLQGLMPDPNLTLDDWSNKFRKLSSKSAAEPGPYRIDRTPFLIDIAKELSPSSPTKEVIFIKPAQVGATELALNFIGYIIHLTPGPVMLVEPTENLCRKISKQRLDDMIETSPELSKRVGESKSRDAENTIFEKGFMNGYLFLVGANSPANLRSVPVKFLILDEVDEYPLDVSNQGDPVQLATARTTTFPRGKVFMLSTPTLEETSRIWKEYLKSDQRKYFVPCPHCGHKQILTWPNLVYDESNPENVSYKCESCTALIEERHKTLMLKNGEWRSTSVASDKKKVGFHINGLYSPLGWLSWATIVNEFIDSKGDDTKFKAWVNTRLGEPYRDELTQKLNASALKERVENFNLDFLPKEIILIVAGCDVQGDRIEVSFWGYGFEDEMFALRHVVIFGDPSKPEIWRQLDSVLDTTKFEHEIYMPLSVRCAAIDSGGSYTHECYQYTRERKKKKYIAIKGSSRDDSPLIARPKKVDINYKGKSLKSGAELNMLNVTMIKDILLPRWRHGEKVHFHASLNDDYFDQLTSEKKVVKIKNGQPKYVYVRDPNKRNEALDCAVYSWGALAFLKRGYNPGKFYEFMANANTKKLKPTEKKEEDTSYPQVKTEIEKAEVKPQRKKRRLITSSDGWR